MHQQHMIVFDSDCGFCSGAVRFLADRDRHARFRFVPIQSETGGHVLRTFGLDPETADTLLLVKMGRAYVRSDAVIEIARDLPGAWRLLSVGYLIPRVLRDGLYRFIARHRHCLGRSSGNESSCRLPPSAPPEES